MSRTNHAIKDKHARAPQSHRAPSRSVRWVDNTTFVVAILEPLITIPQAVVIFRTHTAAGVSLSTWVGYEILTVVWLWYAIVHRNKMVFIYQGLFMVIQTFVIIGGFMYSAKW